MATNIGSININVDTSQVVSATAAITSLGTAATRTQALLASLATVNLSPTTTSANTLASSLTGVAAQAARTGAALRQMTQVRKLDVARDILNIRSFHDIQREIDLTKAAYNRLANSGTVSGRELQVANQAHLESIKKLKAEMSGMANSSGGGGGIGGLLAQMSGISPGMMAAGGAIAGVGAAAIGVGKALYDAYQPVQSLRMGLNALGQDGNSAMLSMMQSANDIGVAFNSVSKGLLQFSAATAGTSLEGAKANEIFTNVAGTIKLFGGSAEQVDGAMKALTQTLGKGTVSSEEIRQQLGEHLPGAFRLAAESMGMSQAELVKALKSGAIDSEGFLLRLSDLLREKYGKGIEAAADTTKSELAKAGNDWQMFTAHLGKNVDTAMGKVMALINEMRTLKDMNLPGVIEGAHESIKKGAENNGLTPDQQAQVKIDAYNATRKVRPELPEIKTTKVEILDSGVRNVRKLSPAEQYAEHTGAMYRDDNKGGRVALGYLDNHYLNLKETEKKKEDDIKSAAWKKKDHADQMTLAEQYRKATLSHNKAELSRLEILREQRDLQTRLKGAGDNQEKKDDVIAQSLQRQADITVKYEDKTKKKGGLSVTQRQDLKADGYDSQIDHMFDRWAIGATKIQEGAVAAAMQEIDLARQRKQEEIDTALKFKKITQARHDAEIANLNKEAVLAKSLATTRIEAEEAQKAAKTERENQLKIEQNVLKIMQQQRDEITKAAKESAKMNADLEKLVKNTNRGIARDLTNANPMADKVSLQREDYINKATDPLTNQLDGLQSKMEQLNEVMGREDGITQGMMDDYNNLTDTIEKTKQAISDMANTSGSAFDKMQADSKSLPLSMTGAANAYIQSVDVAKLSTSLASNTVTEFGSTLSEALGSKEGWKNREQGIKNYFASMLKQISNMVIQLGVVKPLMESVFGGASGTPSAGASMWLGAIAKIGLSLGGGPVEGDTNFMGPMQPVPHAVGGVFGGGHGIYSQPTLFNDSNGRLGVLGEKDSEGILPLKRGKDGKLGVIASGGGGGAQINNFTPSIIIQGNADDEAIAKMTAALRAEFKQHVSQSINKNNVKSQRPGGMNYR